MKKVVIRILVCVLIFSLALPSVSTYVQAEEEFPPTPINYAPIAEHYQFLPDRLELEDHSLAEVAFLPELAEKFSGEVNETKPREYTPPSAETITLTQAQVQAFDCSTVTDVPEEECEALVALYESTNGAGWNYSADWLTGTTVGNWYAVLVSNGHVVQLFLMDNNLYGSIPPEIGNLVSLHQLLLNHNMLAGNIPESFINLVNLCEPGNLESPCWGSIGLDLGYNAFAIDGYSQILFDFLALKDPDWITKQQLGPFSGCENISSIPFSECQALVDLYNSTSGANWTDNSFWLTDSNPNIWYGVTIADGHVTHLNLQANQLDGPIPESFVNLSHLIIEEVNGYTTYGLDLSKNRLNTEGYSQDLLDFLAVKDPDWIYTQSMGPFISCNEVETILPVECETLVALYNTTNGDNWISNDFWMEDANPALWDGVKVLNGHVTSLYLSMNNLSGNLPSALGELTYLETLSMFQNDLYGTIPPELGNLSNLTYLRFSLNNLYGNIPPELGQLTKLTYFSLGSNGFSGNIPFELSKLTNLENLYLQDNNLTGPIPTWLENMPNLLQLGLGTNNLIGTIPSELSSLSNLQTLQLNGNQLTGSIPSWLGDLTNLQYLYLDNNQFNGSIPPELGELPNLYELRLNNNQFTEPIPPELGNLANLQYLYMDDNQFSGVIPPELGDLTKLKRLNLESNQLTGYLPLRFMLLTDLNYFDFSENEVCEPQSIGFLAWKATVTTWIGTGMVCNPFHDIFLPSITR